MKYYVILLVTYTDGTADKVGIYSQTDEDAMLKAMYGYMSTYTNGENVSTVNVEAKNNVGGTYGNLVWSKKTTETAE